MDTKRFVLISDRVRSNANAALLAAPDGALVTIRDSTRSLDQNAFFHALCYDLAASAVEWCGGRRTADEWKLLTVSGHAVATKQGGEIVMGIEGELVAIRESTASMTVARASSLIEYVLAFCTMHGVELRETKRGGFLGT